MKFKLFAVLALAFFATAVSASAACDDSQVIMRLSDTANAHGELWNGGSGYANPVCFNDIFGVMNQGSNPHTCTSSNKFLRLDAATNAHGQTLDYSGAGIYAQNVCFGSYIECTYSLAACSLPYHCVVSMEANTDAHLGLCNAYPLYVCCKTDTTPPIVNLAGAPAGWSGQSQTATVTCSDPESGCSPSSYAVSTFDSYPAGGCSNNYADYTLGGSVQITDYKWVCAAAKNNAGIAGFSSPVEFRIDKQAPLTTINYTGEWKDSTQTINLTCQDQPAEPRRSGCHETWYCIDSLNSCTPNSLLLGINYPSIDISRPYPSYIRYRSDDNALPTGNTESIRSAQVRVCNLTSASISPACSGGVSPLCEPGELVTVNAAYTAGCPPTTYLQVDAQSPDQACNISQQGGNAVGINITCTSSVCSGQWQIPLGLSSSCKGKQINAQFASISENGFPGQQGSIYVDGVKAAGSFTTYRDLAVPSVSITLNNGDFYSNSRTITARSAASDNTGLLFCYIYWGDGTRAMICDGSCLNPLNNVMTHTYASDGTKQALISCSDTSANVENSTDSIAIDTVPPVAWINPLPLWVKTWDGFNVEFAVSWNGSDGISGMGVFHIQFNYTVGMPPAIQNWIYWTNSTANGSAIFGYKIPNGPDAGAEIRNYNNYTFSFRINASDAAGNWFSYQTIPPFANTTVDIVAPACTMGSLPAYTGNPFTLGWSGSDGESGIASYNVQYSNKSRDQSGWYGWRDIAGICTPISQNSSSCSGLDNSEYRFRCNATDRAGNTGGWSAEVSTLVDLSGPVAGFAYPDDATCRPYTFDASHTTCFIASRSFRLGWSGQPDPGGSGIKCYHVQWKSGAGSWQYIDNGTSSTACTAANEIVFGPQLPVQVAENVSYEFRLWAEDNAGNSGGPVYKNITVDTTPPAVEFNVTDQDGNPITGEVLQQGVTAVNITAMSSDGISGVWDNNLIVWEGTNYFDRDSTGVVSCRIAAEPFGGRALCYAIITNIESTRIKYKVLVYDRAGNMAETGWRYLVKYPLANFDIHYLRLTLGESFTVNVQARNLQDQPDTITLMLSGYPLARFVNDTGLNLSSDFRTLTLAQTNPGAELSFRVLGYATQSGQFTGGNALKLEASNSLPYPFNKSNEDNLDIEVGFNPAFPGLEWWGFVLLICLAALAYYRLEK